MKTKAIISAYATLLFCFAGITAVAQSTTIKSTSGNGPVLSGLNITNAEAVGNLKEMGSQLATPIAGSDEVDVRFSFGRITQYRYNGKAYKSEEFNGNCKYSCFDCVNQKVKVTATIKAGGKTYTENGTVASATGLHHFAIKLPGLIKSSTISLISLAVEGMAYPEFEQQLEQYEQCLKKEKEKKEEKEKKQTATPDDGFWNGSEKEAEEKIVKISVSNKDFWSGKETEKEKEKSSGTAKGAEVVYGYFESYFEDKCNDKRIYLISNIFKYDNLLMTNMNMKDKFHQFLKEVYGYKLYGYGDTSECYGYLEYDDPINTYDHNHRLSHEQLTQNRLDDIEERKEKISDDWTNRYEFIEVNGFHPYGK